MIKLHLGDGEKALKEMEENQYDLAIVDPPYGIGENPGRALGRARSTAKWENPKAVMYKGGDWDIQPDKSYFDELIRISKSQIMWGANHYISKIPYDSSCWLVWYKKGQNPNSDFADCELAYSSFKTAVRYFNFAWTGFGAINAKEKRIHPTQKPVALYKWQLKNYGFNKDGTKRTILDTHFGSLSIGIACADMGFDLTAYEIDEDYFSAAIKRLHNHINQLDAFIKRPEVIVNDIPIDQWINKYK